MNTTVFPANDIIRFDRGTTGFLDLFTLINEDQARTFQPILAPAGEKAQLMFVNILEAAKFATASEITVRRNERLIRVGRGNLMTAFDWEASVLNHQAIRHASRALKYVNDLREELHSGLAGTRTPYRMLPEKESAEPLTLRNEASAALKLRDVTRLPEFSDALADAKEAFLTNALQLNFTNNGDFVEVLEIWDQTMARTQKEGVAGLLGDMVETLEQFISRRQTEERGTSPASPLPWWKYVVIAWYASSVVFAVVACFIWSGCSWVWNAIATTAPWIFKIVEMGC
jgi:hypothetical protein